MVARDIDERKNAEQEKKKLEDLLQQAQKMEAIGTLAGGIAHDFNNMLNAIIGYSDLLISHFSKESKDYLYASHIKEAGQRAADLIVQILTFSRRNENRKNPLQIQFVLKDALQLLRGSLPTTIEIQQEINPKCGFVFADVTQMHQVIMNLCTNAYHAIGLATVHGIVKDHRRTKSKIHRDPGVSMETIEGGKPCQGYP